MFLAMTNTFEVHSPPPEVFGTPSLRPKIYPQGKMVYGRDRLVRLDLYASELRVRSTKYTRENGN